MKRFHIRRKETREFTTTHIIALGFLGAILVGTLLLSLPIAVADGNAVHFMDSLFTATTAVCVTGLVTVPTFAHWTLFGQIVIAILVQVGGLGIITFTMMFLILLRRRLGLKERLLIRDAYNLDTIQGMVSLILKILKGTALVEGIGALFYMTVFVPEYGISGIWKSIFNAISAFCNAGMDVLGPDSLEAYVGNPVINFTTMALIILGGLGFPVWWTILDMIRDKKRQKKPWRVVIHHMPVHAKVVLSTTVGLIAFGAVLVFVLEYNNPDTMGSLPLGQKIMASLFQSVTTRTAGFATVSQAGLSKATALICCMLMFIGGSPSGTAGGVKTTTVMILIFTVISILRGRNDTELFDRKVNANVERRALSIFMVSFGVLLVLLTALCAVQPGNLIDCLYEMVSAIATVGLTRDFTASLNTAGQLIIILAMYLGRIGPISLALFFNTNHFVNLKTYPEGKIGVG